MRSSYPAGGFRGNNVDGMWQAVEELRSRFEKRSGSRAGRGEVRSAVLALLAERPMHGYQIIREIEERSGGTWKPSAGSVYPTLQLLADEGLIRAEESNGRKIYSLTDAGREEMAGAGMSAPWESTVRRRARGSRRCPRRASSSHKPPPRWDAPARRSRCRRPWRCSTTRAAGCTRSSPRADGGDVGSPGPGSSGTRRRGPPGPLPPHPALRRVASRGDLVVRAAPPPHRAGEDCRAHQGEEDAALRAALPCAGGGPRRPHDQSRTVPVLPARRAAARDHQGTRGAAGRGASGFVLRDPRPRRS